MIDSEGNNVGVIVGARIGCTVCDFDGDLDRDDVGISEGDVVGKYVGIIDGLIIGDSQGHLVGELLGNPVGCRW